jgi:pSer/pThr/pTyr-binding forkhead associated (FHA) protein
MSPPTAHLEIVAGNATGMSIMVDDEMLFGRHAQGAGRLADDPEISRSHARVTLEQGGFCAIEDLGSTNGTFVNGLRINGPTTLSEGDTIELGSTTLVVRELPANSVSGEFERPPSQATVAPGTLVDPGVPDVPTEEVSAVSGDEEPGAFLGLAPMVEESEADQEVDQDLDQEEELLEPTEFDGPPEFEEAPAAVGDPAADGPATLRLQIEVDFVAREARVFLDDHAEPLQFGLDGGAWRLDVPPDG